MIVIVVWKLLQRQKQDSSVTAIDFTHRSWQGKLWFDMPDLYRGGDLINLTYTKGKKCMLLNLGVRIFKWQNLNSFGQNLRMFRFFHLSFISSDYLHSEFSLSQGSTNKDSVTQKQMHSWGFSEEDHLV